jgi:hypothetical protein
MWQGSNTQKGMTCSPWTLSVPHHNTMTTDNCLANTIGSSNGTFGAESFGSESKEDKSSKAWIQDIISQYWSTRNICSALPCEFFRLNSPLACYYYEPIACRYDGDNEFPTFQVELYRNDQHRFKIVVDSDNEVDLMVQTRHMRDVVILTIRGLAQKFNSTSLNTLLKIEAWGIPAPTWQCRYTWQWYCWLECV